MLFQCNSSIRGSVFFLLCKVKEHYSDVPVYVMANGVQEDPARFKDSLRVYYLYNYINEALKGETFLWINVMQLVYNPVEIKSSLLCGLNAV